MNMERQARDVIASTGDEHSLYSQEYCEQVAKTVGSNAILQGCL